jgi:predicted metal-dependent hydrolase
MHKSCEGEIQMIEQYIALGSRRIKFQLSHTKRKSLQIRVHPSGKVEVHAPTNSHQVKVLAAVKKKVPWIIKQQAFFDSFNPRTPERRYISGESHRYLGRQYTLRIKKSEEESIKVMQGEMRITSKDISPSAIKETISAWYKMKAIDLFSQLLEHNVVKFKKHRLKPPQLVIRTMNKRWGSYSPSGKMILNKELIKASRACVEYVITHELCHAVHPNHNKAFYKLLETQIPDWGKWKERLEKSLS